MYTQKHITSLLKTFTNILGHYNMQWRPLGGGYKTWLQVFNFFDNLNILRCTNVIPKCTKSDTV